MEKDSLDGWVEKYKHYSEYPVVGRVSFVGRPPARVGVLCSFGLWIWRLSSCFD